MQSAIINTLLKFWAFLRNLAMLLGVVWSIQLALILTGHYQIAWQKVGVSGTVAVANLVVLEEEAPKKKY